MKIDQSFKLTNEVTTIILDFNDEIEIVEVAGDEINLVTYLSSSHQSVLEYQENKHQFKLIPSFQFYDNKATMTLKPKKINTSIFVKGQKHEAKRKYRVELPAHIQIVKQ